MPSRLETNVCTLNLTVSEKIGFAATSNAPPVVPQQVPDHHAHAGSAFQRVNARTMFTQPKVPHEVGVRWLHAFVMSLVKTEESSMPIIKMDRAVWVRTFLNHEPSSRQVSASGEIVGSESTLVT
jgi:hypothetical protein